MSPVHVGGLTTPRCWATTEVLSQYPLSPLYNAYYVSMSAGPAHIRAYIHHSLQTLEPHAIMCYRLMACIATTKIAMYFVFFLNLRLCVLLCVGALPTKMLSYSNCVFSSSHSWLMAYISPHKHSYTKTQQVYSIMVIDIVVELWNVISADEGLQAATSCIYHTNEYCVLHN